MILYYQPPNGDAEKLKRVEQIADNMGISLRVIGEDLLGARLGDLLSGNGQPSKVELPPVASEPFLVLDLDDRLLDEFLDVLRNEGLRFPHKARTTANNIKWTMADLMAHVSEEAALMQALHKLYQLVQISEDFDSANYDPEKWAVFEDRKKEAKDHLAKMGQEELEVAETMKIMENFNRSVLSLMGRE